MRTKGIIFTGICLVSLAGCTMDPVLTTSYPETIAWSSEANVEMYLNKFYPLIGQNYYTPAVSNDACSDILKMNSPTADENLFAYGSVEITPAQNIFENWAWGHDWALQCCRFISDMNKYGTGLPEEVRLRAEAEIRWFRAHVYFEMARRYGASVIIYRTLPELGSRDHERCEPDECWDFIAEDLDFAARNLPLTAAAGKLTKGTAYGLKARAMLYAERWKEATDAVEALDALGLYDLEDDYAELFLYNRSKGTSVESIVEFGFQYPELDYSFDYFYCPPGDGGYAQVSPTEELVSEYQMADGSDFSWNNPEQAADPYSGREPRFYASILYNGAEWKGRTIDTTPGSKDGVAIGGGTTSTGYYMRKLFDPTQTEGFVNSDLTFYYMRYAEVLLIYAEALAQQNRLGDALKALNRVRQRAGFTTGLQTGDKNQFMEWLRHERMIELAFEGHRFWDLRRWGLAVSTLNNTHLTGTRPVSDEDGIRYEQFDSDNGKRRIYLEKYERFPIPAIEIQRNLLMEQFDEWK